MNLGGAGKADLATLGGLVGLVCDLAVNLLGIGLSNATVVSSKMGGLGARQRMSAPVLWQRSCVR